MTKKEWFFTLVFAFVAAVISVWITSCKCVLDHPVKKAVAVKKLKPVCTDNGCRGAYTYQDNGGDWWIYYFALDANLASSPTPYVGYGTSLPLNGNWEKSTPPQEPEVEASEVEISEMGGEPTDASVDSADSSDAGDSGGDDGGGDGGGD